MATLTLNQATDLVTRALMRAGASSAMAQSTARALVRAEAQGIASHGLSRVTQYATHLQNGRANGQAVPQVLQSKTAALVVDAQQGLAFPACDLAIERAIDIAREQGICLAAVRNSHHCGVLVDHLRAVAAAGMVGLGLTNSPAAMPVAGGKHAMLGTNPVAAAFPREGAEPLLIDLSLSEVARGKIMVAAKDGKPIPAGWALDAQGQPTQDATAALAGSMLPIGATTSTKGNMLALVVELLVSALIGAQFGFEASSFFVDAGNQPKIGQTFIVIDPQATQGAAPYFARVEVLIAQMLQDEGVRLPGARRLALEREAAIKGVNVADATLKSIEALLA